MSGLNDFLAPVAVGSQAVGITAQPMDGITAGAYAALVNAITGSMPTVQDVGNGHAQMLLSDTQIIAMRKFLDKQVFGFLTPGVPDTLDLNMGPVVTPWSLKYAITLALLLLAAGWVAHWLIAR